MSEKPVLFTIGFEGRSPEEVLEILKRKRIDCVADIRQNPNSRKPGFSKNRFAESCGAAGIEYIHIKELGTPRIIRDRLKENWDFEFLLREYGKHLEQNGKALQELCELVMEKRICLFCFERDHLRCHRSLVAEKLLERCGSGLSVINL